MTARRPRDRFRLRKRKCLYSAVTTPAAAPPLAPAPACQRPRPRANTCHRIKMQWVHVAVILGLLLAAATPGLCYDPEDPELQRVLASGAGSQFEAFYPREAHGVPNGAARAPHGHGSFYKHRNPALVDVKNAAAYGFRFDGVRRFNFDE